MYYICDEDDRIIDSTKNPVEAAIKREKVAGSHIEYDEGAC